MAIGEVRRVGNSWREFSLVNPDGIDIPALSAYQQKHGTIYGFVKGKTRTVQSQDPVWDMPADVLTPAALENQVNRSRSQRALASGKKYINQIANGPVTEDAKVLWDTKGNVIPDVVSNAGGSAVSNMEVMMNLSGQPWTAGQARQRMRFMVEQAYDDMRRVAKAYGISNRLATEVIALRKLMFIHGLDVPALPKAQAK